MMTIRVFVEIAAPLRFLPLIFSVFFLSLSFISSLYCIVVAEMIFFSWIGMVVDE